jgi:hypothetical protein
MINSCCGDDFNINTINYSSTIKLPAGHTTTDQENSTVTLIRDG